MISRLDRLQMQTSGVRPNDNILTCDIQGLSNPLMAYCLNRPCNECMFRNQKMEELLTEMEQDLNDVRTASVIKRAA